MAGGFQLDPTGGSAPTGKSASGGGGGFSLDNNFSLDGGSSQAPNQLAQNSVNKDLGFILQTGDPKQIAQAQKVAAGKTNSKGGWLGNALHAVANPLSKVLSTLDYPRAVVAAGEHQGYDALTGKGVNLGQFGSEVAHHVTIGHVLAEEEGPKDANSTLGRWNNRILGTIGDVALDPLNFVGGLGEAGKGLSATAKALDAAKVADHAEQAAKATGAAEDVARAAELRGVANEATHGGIITPDTFGTLRTKGVAGLSDDEKSALGLRTGIGVGFGQNKVPIVPGAVTDPVSALAHQVTSAVRDRAAKGALAKTIMPHAAVRAGLRAAADEGDWQKASDLTQLLKTSVIPHASAQAFENKHGPVLAAALKGFKPEEMDSLRGALEGGAHNLDPEKVGAVRTALDAMHSDAASHGVDIGHMQDYFPHQLTDAAAKAAAKGGTPKAYGAFNSELSRYYKPGTKFLGQKLEHGTVDEMNKIAQETHGLDAYNLFKTDTHGVLGSYLHGLGNRVGQQDWANKLDEMGMTHAGDMAATPDDWQQIADHGAFAGKVAPQHISDAMKALKDEAVKSATRKPTGVLKHYDSVLGLWKQYQLAMPGKAIRHAITMPAWQHYIGGTSIPSMTKSFKLWRTFEKSGIDSIKDPADKKKVEEFLQAAVGHGHEFHGLDAAKPNANPLSKNFAYHRANAEVQARTLDYSRFAMFNDAREKGMDQLDAAAKVRSFMGDRNSLTDQEKAVARRVIPFYQFLRTQMPTQLKALAHSPGKFENFVSAEHDASEGTPAQNGVVPSFYNQTMSFELPFKSGQNDTYMSPDLPFTRINQLLSGGNQLVAQTTPLIQLPLEHIMGNTNASTGAPFSTTAQPLPSVMKPLGPVLAALGLASKQKQDQTDFGVTTKAGTYRITSENLQLLDSILPPLGQARRLDTAGEPSMQARQGTTTLSDLLGQNFRTDDPYQQASELYRRDAILKQMVEKLQNEGSLAPYLRGFKK